MGDLFQPTHLLILALILLLLFGGRKLPELGKGLGEGLKSFREGLKGSAEPMQAENAQAAQSSAAALEPASKPGANGKASYRCPHCKALFSASPPTPHAEDEKGFCPECGQSFVKKTAMV
jgi:sec-independent protein translocase protein TatA